MVYELQNFSASLVASSCVYLARQMFGLELSWNRELEEMTSYKEDELQDVTDCLLHKLQEFKIAGKETKLTSIFPLLGKLPRKGMMLLHQKMDAYDENYHPKSS